MKFEVTFHPLRRWVRGEHQATISYVLTAPTIEGAKAAAVRLIRVDHPRVSYRFHSAREAVDG